MWFLVAAFISWKFHAFIKNNPLRIPEYCGHNLSCRRLCLRNALLLWTVSMDFCFVVVPKLHLQLQFYGRSIYLGINSLNFLRKFATYRVFVRDSEVQESNVTTFCSTPNYHREFKSTRFWYSYFISNNWNFYTAVCQHEILLLLQFVFLDVFQILCHYELITCINSWFGNIPFFQIYSAKVFFLS